MEEYLFKDKESFRKYCKKEGNKFTNRNKLKRDKTINKKLIHLIKRSGARDILLYVPLEQEADIRSLFKVLRRKVNIYVPFMEGVSFKMVKFRLPLFKKKFNIREPKNSFAVFPKLDLAVVPVLGVDGALKRVGFGRGMYDRFFDTLIQSPIVVFVQLGECITKEKLCENHDIQADIYITPYKTIARRGNNDNRIKYSSSSSYRKWNSRLLCGKKTRCCKL
jgi:5-formyltetrahydrofolate cyclo-ligase